MIFDRRKSNSRDEEDDDAEDDDAISPDQKHSRAVTRGDRASAAYRKSSRAAAAQAIEKTRACIQESGLDDADDVMEIGSREEGEASDDNDPVEVSSEEDELAAVKGKKGRISIVARAVVSGGKRAPASRQMPTAPSTEPVGRPQRAARRHTGHPP